VIVVEKVNMERETKAANSEEKAQKAKAVNLEGKVQKAKVEEEV
tara:strand:+ start:1261 stop:1392 length:132 start_codon:yes stop_codon:yes gene_type:complete